VLVFSYGNVALKYLPGNIDEIFSKYIDIIDRDVSDQKVEIIKRIKGTATLSVDGVTILSKSYLLIFEGVCVTIHQIIAAEKPGSSCQGN
jgi:hypothetical protein